MARGKIMAGKPEERDERKRELEERFRGWRIWYVPRQGGGAWWCAHPLPLLNCDSPEELAGTIQAAHREVVPETLAVASPRGYAARVRRLREQQEAAVADWQRMSARPRRPRRRVSPPP
jgi:hypothetical protein